MPSSTDVLIPLTNGPVVPESVVLWMISAETRGLTFTVRADGRLVVSPRERVNDEDDAFIRSHRDLLRACVDYCDRMVQVPL